MESETRHESERLEQKLDDTAAEQEIGAYERASPARSSVSRRSAGSVGKPLLNILFVENHAIFAATVVAEFLHMHEVVVVASVAAGRTAFQAQSVDVVLVDYDLDDTKGDVLVREVRLLDALVPIVAVSAKHDGNEALLRAGASAVCHKSEFSRILEVINELLDRRLKSSCRTATTTETPRELLDLVRRLEERGYTSRHAAFFAPTGFLLCARHDKSGEAGFRVVENGVFLYPTVSGWCGRITVHGGNDWVKHADTIDELELVALEALSGEGRPPSPGWVRA